MSESEWAGGFFEIEMYLGEISNQSARRFANGIWQYPSLSGPHRERTLGTSARMQFSEYGAVGYGGHQFLRTAAWFAYIR